MGRAPMRAAVVLCFLAVQCWAALPDGARTTGPVILDVSDDPDLVDPAKRGPGLWDPMQDGSYDAYQRTHESVSPMPVDSDEEQEINGEAAALGVLAGGKLVPGTVDQLEPQAKRGEMGEGMEVDDDDAQKKKDKNVGESAQQKSTQLRVNSLLLAKGSFILEAASREDGMDDGTEVPAVQLGEAQSLI